jgi:hypothetical protein
MAARERTGADLTRLRGQGQGRGNVKSAVGSAIVKGYVIGRRVLLGTVPGTVIGYNIARFGRFRGATYPLLVRTAFGVAKCGLDELALV